jgi:hypothetical protein
VAIFGKIPPADDQRAILDIVRETSRLASLLAPHKREIYNTL